MDEIITDITNEIARELVDRDIQCSEESMLEALEERYNTAYFALMYSAEPGACMVTLVAIKQMIDTLNHFNK